LVFFDDFDKNDKNNQWNKKKFRTTKCDSYIFFHQIPLLRLLLSVVVGMHHWEMNVAHADDSSENVPRQQYDSNTWHYCCDRTISECYPLNVVCRKKYFVDGSLSPRHLYVIFCSLQNPAKHTYEIWHCYKRFLVGFFIIHIIIIYVLEQSLRRLTIYVVVVVVVVT